PSARELLAGWRSRIPAQTHDPGDVFRPDAEGRGDDLVQQARNSPRLLDGQALPEPQAVLVWRIHRSLPRGYAGRRHDRNRREDVGGRIRNAAHETASRD